MGDRSSWMSREAKVNGLFAAHLPRRRKNKIIPTSHADSERANAIQSELDAFKNIMGEESKMKDNLLESVSKRCSDAEASLEQALLEKARVERELEKIKITLEQREEVQDKVENIQAIADDAKATTESLRTKAQHLETELLKVTRELHHAKELHAKQIQEKDNIIQEFQNALQAQKEKAAQLLEQHEEELMAQKNNQASFLEAQHQSRAKQEALVAQYEELSSDSEALKKRLAAVESENSQMKQANGHIVDRLELAEATLENTRKKAAKQLEQLKEQEDLAKHLSNKCNESEAKASRLADQLKSSSKKSTFMAKKSSTVEKKLEEKESEIQQLQTKLADMQKKYKLAKERLDYVQRANQSHDTTKSRNGGSNNDEEDPSGTAPQLLPGMPGSSKRVLRHIKAAAAPCRTESGTDRHEDQTTTVAERRQAENSLPKPETIPDPSLAPDSGAPDWIKF